MLHIPASAPGRRRGFRAAGVRVDRRRSRRRTCGLGAGIGIGRIGGQATEGIARQPEASAQIQTAMIIAAVPSPLSFLVSFDPVTLHLVDGTDVDTSAAITSMCPSSW